MEFWLVLFAFISGIIASMGLGGGTVFIPLLTVFLDINQLVAQGLNLIGFWFVAPVALLLHIKNKLIVFKPVLFILVFALPFSAVGAWLAHNTDIQVLRRVFGGFLILLSLIEFYGLFTQKKVKSYRQS